MSREGTSMSFASTMARSRVSFQDEKAPESRPGSQASSQLAFLDHEEVPPTPAPEDLYGEREITVVSPNPVVNVKEKKTKQKKGGGFLGFLRSFWATRQTENTEADKELYIKTTLRELIIYLIFLIVLCIITFGMSSTTMFYYTKVMSELFLDSQFPDTKNTFRGMTTMHDFWRFVETPLVDGLYWETWYNDQAVSEDEKGYIFYENKLMGVPRVRQVKVRNDSCIVHDDFKDEILVCYDAYAGAIEDKFPFGKNNGTAWTYNSALDAGGRGYWGYISSYGAGGFYQDLSITKEESMQQMQELKSNLWLDRGSRAVFIDFTVYNANINLFCVIKLVVELPATGGAIPSWSFRTVKLIRYVSTFDYFILGCEGLYVLFILYYFVEEVLEIRIHKVKYLKGFWNWLDMIMILISLICIAFNGYRTMAVGKKLDGLLSTPESFADFDFLSFWQTQFNSALAVTVFLAWIKIFKYISFNKTMTQLSSTMARCSKDLLGFLVMFFIIFFAFAQLGYLIFGTQIKDFSSFGTAIFTLFRIVLGDFDFHELENAERVLGPIYFLLYVFFVFFVLLNMFLAIINDTYAAVKEELAGKENEFEITDYFKKGLMNMKQKLNSKKDKIIDMRDVLDNGDENNDNQLDYDEWKQDLKVRGYADDEISAVFEKYDLNNDKQLDAEERAMAKADLEGQGEIIDSEYKQIKGADGQSNGRRTEVDPEIGMEDFIMLNNRVERMELQVSKVVNKVEGILDRLENMDRVRASRKDVMKNVLDTIADDDAANDRMIREQMESVLKQEIERCDMLAEGAVRPFTRASSGRSQRSRSAASKEDIEIDEFITYLKETIDET